MIVWYYLSSMFERYNYRPYSNEISLIKYKLRSKLYLCNCNDALTFQWATKFKFILKIIHYFKYKIWNLLHIDIQKISVHNIVFFSAMNKQTEKKNQITVCFLRRNLSCLTRYVSVKPTSRYDGSHLVPVKCKSCESWNQRKGETFNKHLVFYKVLKLDIFVKIYCII